MTTPPHDPWDQELRPVDPQTLPPGFYFPPGVPPGQEPKPPASGSSIGLKWLLVVFALLVVIVGIVVALFASRGSGRDGAIGMSPASSGSFVDVIQA
jgi:hypothetical protein